MIRILSALLLLGAPAAAAPVADLVITNGHVYAADGKGGGGTAVAVAGGRIVAVGSEADIAPLRGPATKVIDARGGTVTPGLIDTHVHFLDGAATLDQVDVTGVRDGAAMVERVRAYAAANPGKPLIEGFGYFADTITRRDLDRALPDRPVILRSGDAHWMLANSKALALAGVTKATTAPAGGVIGREADGEPNGRMLEAAQRLLDPAFPAPTPERGAELLAKANRAALAAGVTTIVNVGGPDNLAVFDAARKAGQAGPRIIMALWLSGNVGSSGLPEGFDFTEADADAFDAIRARMTSDDRLSLNMVKIMLDGVIESHTAKLLAPYADRPGDTGHANYTPAELDRVIAMMDRRGWQIMTHALGDGAVRMTLDAYQAAAAANPAPPQGRRHKIEHIESIDPSDVPRFAALGVTASMQPDHAFDMNDRKMAGPRWAYLGHDRSAWGWPWRSIGDAGGLVAFGSDWPVASLNIGSGLGVATGRLPHPPAPPQALTVAQVIDGYTRNAARSLFLDGDRGTLAPGYRADITIFSRDIMAPAKGSGSRHHADLPIAYTLMDGKPVWQAPSAP